jgi:hypothetical protein
MAASNRLDWRKNLSPLSIPPFIKQGLGGLACFQPLIGEYHHYSHNILHVSTLDRAG